MRKPIAAICSLSILLSVLAGVPSAQAIYDIGNGAGGLINHGQYMTYYSAQIFIKKEPLARDEIKGLNFLLDLIPKLQLDQNAKAQLMTLLLPTSQRRYFTWDPANFSKQQYRQMISLYADLMHVPAEKVAILALTNPETHETLLLPDFSQLKSVTEQASILFHESLWLSQGTDQSYGHIVAAEQAAQAFFESPTDGKKYYSFYTMLADFLNSPKITFQAAFSFDQRLAVPWALRKGQQHIPLTAVLDSQFLHCALRDVGQSGVFMTLSDDPSTCAQASLPGLIENYHHNPESLFLRARIDALGANRIVSMGIQDPRYTDSIEDFGYIARMSENDFITYLNSLYVSFSADDLGSQFTLNIELADGTRAGWISF